MAARKIRDKAAKIAAHLPEVGEEDLEWEPGMEATNYYDPPNLTFPFGIYICVMDLDQGTGDVTVRRLVAVDDCGNIINSMGGKVRWCVGDPSASAGKVTGAEQVKGTGVA